jgi:hypothetical protein
MHAGDLRVITSISMHGGFIGAYTDHRLRSDKASASSFRSERSTELTPKSQGRKQSSHSGNSDLKEQYMSLLFYATDTKGTGKSLWNLYEELASEDQTKFFHTIDSLSQELRRSKWDLSIAVLLAGTQTELMEILSIRHLLDRIRIILILPDREKETISRGHKLYPRFLSYADGNFKDVAAVLAKMLERMNRSTPLMK